MSFNRRHRTHYRFKLLPKTIIVLDSLSLCRLRTRVNDTGRFGGTTNEQE